MAFLRGRRDRDESSAVPEEEKSKRPRFSMPERTHYTGEDIERKLRERREAKQAAREAIGEEELERRKISRRRVIITAALVGLSGVVVTSTSISTSASHEQERAALTEAAQNRAEMSEVEAEQTDMPVQEDVETAYVSAQEDGKRISDLQNAYITTTAKDKIDTKALRSTRDDLRELMTEDAVSGGGLDPSQPWLQLGSESGGAKGTDRHSWSFLSVDGVDGTSMNVTWVNKDADGKILAWVMASYDGESGKFSQFERGLTKAGNDLMGSTAPAGGESEYGDGGGPPEIDKDAPLGEDGEDL